MRIQSIQCFAGRNIYSHKPVVKVTLDIGELYKLPTKDLGDFNERLLALFPGLKNIIVLWDMRADLKNV